MARPLFGARILRSVPRWLGRTRGLQLLGGIGDVVDEEVTSLYDAIRARFPSAGAPIALATTGRERRIRRGPQETAATYASRLPRWWDAHRARGSSFEMLRQLHAFFKASLDVRIDIVATSGLRHWVDADVELDEMPDAMTRDQISWDPFPTSWHTGVALIANANPGDTSVRITSIAEYDIETRKPARLKSGTTVEEVLVVGNDGIDRLYLSAPIVGTFNAGPSTLERARIEWAHLWVILHLDGPPSVEVELFSQAGINITTQSGDDLLVITDLSGGDPLADEQAEVYRCIPREWKAAHIPYVTVVLRWGAGELWDYPVPVGTWDEPGGIWDEDDPVVLIAE